MNIADWIIIAVVVISCLISLWRGFVKEALSLAIWAGAFFIAMLFYPNMEQVLAEWISAPSLLRITSFGVIFIAVLLCGGLINTLIGMLIKATGLSGTDRLLGMIFGFVRGIVVLLSAFVLIPKMVPIEEDAWFKESVLIPQILLLEDWSIAITQELYSASAEVISTSEELVE